MVARDEIHEVKKEPTHHEGELIERARISKMMLEQGLRSLEFACFWFDDGLLSAVNFADLLESGRPE